MDRHLHHDAGDHTLAAHSSGTDHYLPAAASTDLTVSPAQTLLTYAGDTTGAVGESLPVAAALTNLAGAEPAPQSGSPSTSAVVTSSASGPHLGTAPPRASSATFLGAHDYSGSSVTADVAIDPAEAAINYLGDTDAAVGTPLEVRASLALAAQPATAPTDDEARGARVLALAAVAAAPGLAGHRLLFTLGTEQCEGLTDVHGVATGWSARLLSNQPRAT